MVYARNPLSNSGAAKCESSHRGIAHAKCLQANPGWSIIPTIMMSRLWARLSGKQNIAIATLADSSESPVNESASVPLETQTRPKTGRSGNTFAVDSVTRAEKPIWSETLADSLDRRFQRKILVLPGERDYVINEVVDSLGERMRATPIGEEKWPIPKDGKKREMIISRPCSRYHPFIDAVHIAFSQHRPLTLSPDAIFCLFSKPVN